MSNRIPLVVAGRLLGFSPEQTWRRVRNGTFPPLSQIVSTSERSRGAHVDLALFEERFGRVSPERLAAAMHAPVSKKPRTWPRKYSRTHVERILECRDIQWLDWVRERFDFLGPMPALTESFPDQE